MLRKLVVACSLLTACQAERSAARLDVSSLYVKQGQTLVPRAKVAFETLLLGILPSDVQPTKNDSLFAKVTPDPDTLTFETPAPVGSAFDIGLFAGKLNDDGSLQKLDYIGLTRSVSFAKGQTTDVAIELVPAALMSFRLGLPKTVEATLQQQGVDLTKLDCNVAVQREGAVEGGELERKFAPAISDGLVFDPQVNIIRALLHGNEVMLAGRYTVGAVAFCQGFQLKLAAASVDLAQSDVQTPMLTVTGVVGEVINPTKQVVGFDVFVKDSGGTRRVNTGESIDTPSFVMQAVNNDGSDDVTFTGDVFLSVHTVDSGGSLLHPNTLPASALDGLHFVDPGTSAEVGAGQGVRVLHVENGRGEYRLYYNVSDPPTPVTHFFTVQAVDNLHFAGYTLVSLSPNAARCGNNAQTTTSIDQLRAFSFVENEIVAFNGGTPLASHLFVGLLWGTNPGLSECVAEPSALPAPLHHQVGVAVQRFFDSPGDVTVELVDSQHLEITKQDVTLAPQNNPYVEMDAGAYGRLFLMQTSSLGGSLQRGFLNGITGLVSAAQYVGSATVYTKAYFLDKDAAPFNSLVENAASTGSLSIGEPVIPVVRQR